jgi:hypothetical protein
MKEQADNTTSDYTMSDLSSFFFNFGFFFFHIIVLLLTGISSYPQFGWTRLKHRRKEREKKNVWP